MKLPDNLAAEPMTVTHFRLVCRHFGTTPTQLLALLENTGVDPDALEAMTTVTIGQQVQQIVNLNRLFGPGWFLAVREQLHFSAHGAVTLAAQTAPTVEDSLAILCNFIEVRLPLQRARLTRQGASAVLTLEPAGDYGLTLDVWRPFLFISMVSIRSLIASIMAGPAGEARFAFMGPRPDYADELEAMFEAPLSFEAASDSMSIPASWLTIASAFADTTLYTSAITALNGQAAMRARPPRALRFRVEQLLAECAAGRMDATDCARALGLSRRTMTRRLADEGTGFRQLLDHDLRRRALDLIETGGMTNARIADQLGYQNPASFHRAMQRWQRPAG
jgi:AraC-like DNA-binding protein